MGWNTGQHAEAPTDALCFGGPEPGTVVWYTEDAVAPPGRDAPAAAPTAPPPTTKASTKGG